MLLIKNKNMRNILFIIFFIIINITSIYTLTEQQIESTKKLIRNMCQPKSKATNEQIDNFHKGIFDNEKSIKCYINCVMNSMKIIKNGKLDVEGAMAQIQTLPKSLQKPITNSLNKCKDSGVSSEKCEYSFEIAKCVYLSDPECQWPILDPKSADPNIILKEEVKPVQVMLLADTHLLGSRNGHWFDKLRREWQMRRSFQTAVQLFKPEIIFVLGDLFDEGLWCSSEEFQYYVKRFHTLFSVPDNIKIYVVAGNHDIGFHYGISPFLMERFTVAFDAPAVKLVTIRGNHFVLVNSMAMEGDGCFLCRPAELQVNNIDVRLKCTKGVGRCKKNMHLGQYSRPILLQHYPLFRESDGLRCDDEGDDNAPEAERTVLHRERWDCLSRDASNVLLETLNPRLSIGGHTHHSCHRIHVTRTSQITEEFSISSFSWRNKNNPSFLLATITPNNYSIRKCHLPEESTVCCLYLIGLMVIFVYFALLYRRMYKIGPCRSFKPFKRL